MAKLVRESVSFQRGLDPKQALGVGQIEIIKKWCEKIFNPKSVSWSINKDLKIDLSPGSNGYDSISIFDDNIDLSSIPTRFGTVKLNFYVAWNENLPPLKDWFPEEIQGDLHFYKNNIRAKLLEFREISSISGVILLKNPNEIGEEEARKRYRDRGTVKSRKSPDLRTIGPIKGSFTHSGSYKLYKALEYIDKAGPEGARRSDIIDTIYKISNRGAFAPQGWGAGWFNYYPRYQYIPKSPAVPKPPKPKGPLYTYTDKISRGKYILNQIGKDKLEELKKKFDDK